MSWIELFSLISSRISYFKLKYYNTGLFKCLESAWLNLLIHWLQVFFWLFSSLKARDCERQIERERERVSETDWLSLISTDFAALSKSYTVNRYWVWEESCYTVVGQHHSV